eukprot:SAG31_NODE_650_length_13187_cov_3.011843_13_plen_55_part_00
MPYGLGALLDPLWLVVLRVDVYGALLRLVVALGLRLRARDLDVVILERTQLYLW